MGISAVNLQVFVLFAFILIHIKSINKAREGKEKKRKEKKRMEIRRQLKERKEMIEVRNKKKQNNYQRGKPVVYS